MPDTQLHVLVLDKPDRAMAAQTRREALASLRRRVADCYLALNVSRETMATTRALLASG